MYNSLKVFSSIRSTNALESTIISTSFSSILTWHIGCLSRPTVYTYSSSTSVFQCVTWFADSSGFVLQTWAKWFSLPHEVHLLFFVGQLSLYEGIFHRSSYIFCRTFGICHGCVTLGDFVDGAVCLSVVFFFGVVLPHSPFYPYFQDPSLVLRLILGLYQLS